LSESELHRIQNDRQLRRRLETSYLPTISAPDWDDALSLTENRTTTNSGWWTVMVAGTSGHFGLTAPQEGSGTELSHCSRAQRPAPGSSPMIPRLARSAR
jgi:hypothetical protein